MKQYLLEMEISGPIAMFTRVDTGGTPTSLPVPTWSAAKSIFEAIAFLADGSAWIAPLMIEVCRRKGSLGGSLRYESYATNYGGLLRKASLVSAGNNMQLYATVLADVCYRLHAEVRGAPRTGRNPRHHLHDLFQRRLARGQCHHAPALGWREFTCSYWGPFRDSTEVDTALTIEIPSMLVGVWDKPVGGAFAPSYVRAARIEQGVFTYAQ